MLVPRLDIAHFGRGLAVRLLLLLSLTLLPIGAVAIYQTASLSTEVRARAENEVLGRTLAAVTEQAVLLERAVGAVETLARLSASIINDPNCSATFQNFVKNGPYSFAGILPRDGIVRCSSLVGDLDVTDTEIFGDAFADEQPFAYATPRGRASGLPVVVFGHPVYVEDELDHFVVVSVAQDEATGTLGPLELEDAASVVTFNANGQVLTAARGLENITDRLPRDRGLRDLATNEKFVFTGYSTAGNERIFTVVPIREGLVYAMASYPLSVIEGSGAAGRLPPWLLPFLMWFGTLVVVWVAVTRLAVSPIRLLARRMRRFAQNRQMPTRLPQPALPQELVEMNETFETMAEAILRDEAELEHSLREKSVLVREIHHRVKNNLQLIASIMNMQIRKSRQSETSEVVRRLQERVLGLATVHRQMYENANLTDVAMKPLLSEILRQILREDGRYSPRIETEIGDASLVPDQAVPLALLAAEASLNAVRFVGTGRDEDAWIRVEFGCTEDEGCRFVARNSITQDQQELDRLKGRTAGLGTQLIHAFAAQLGGTLETTEKDGVFSIEVVFRPTVGTVNDAAAEVIARYRSTDAA